MQITVDCFSDAGPLRPFWNSTGFTPATLLLTNDMRQQVTLWGSIPRAGLRYARVHYLLELVDVSFAGEEPRCDWSRLDQGLDLLVKNGMAPIFELMGNPGGQFTDFNNHRQLLRWRALVRALALHLLERYGAGEVERWYFETWNEPDIGFGWPQWPGDEVSFCNYYDACADGLLSASPNLLIGGPGTCITLSGLFRAFLEHCDRGTNYFTGRPGARLDFISVHEKAARAHKEELTPRTARMLEREMQAAAYIRRNHPRFAGLPFMNNECDPQVGWKDHHTWHAASYYAAWMCKSAVLHLEHLQDKLGVRYALLSNDNGFIGEWGQRSLLARFGKAGWIEDGQSGHAARRGWAERDFHTPEFAMIKKPAFTAVTLLSLLLDGEPAVRRLRMDKTGSPSENEQDLFCLATLGKDGGVAILAVHSQDRIHSSGAQAVRLRLKNLPFPSAFLAHYRIDEEHTNPFALWEAEGAPDQPDRRLLDAMREVQEAALLYEPHPVTTQDGNLDLKFDLPLHGVSLILLLPKPAEAPEQVTGLRLETFAGLNGQPEHLLRWDPLPGRAVRTYLVLYSPSSDGPYTPAPGPELLCSAAFASLGRGYYRVAACDFWGRTGPASSFLSI